MNTKKFHRFIPVGIKILESYLKMKAGVHDVIWVPALLVVFIQKSRKGKMHRDCNKLLSETLWSDPTVEDIIDLSTEEKYMWEHCL